VSRLVIGRALALLGGAALAGGLVSGCGAAGYERSAMKHEMAAGELARAGDYAASSEEVTKAQKKRKHAAQEEQPDVPWMAPPAPHP
jgi:hypothetical protein